MFGNASFAEPKPDNSAWATKQRKLDPFTRNTHAWSQREALAMQMIEGELTESPAKMDSEPKPEELDALMDKATEIATRITVAARNGNSGLTSGVTAP